MWRHQRRRALGAVRTDNPSGVAHTPYGLLDYGYSRRGSSLRGGGRSQTMRRVRSRPGLTVFLSPKRPLPGDRLEVRAVLDSRSVTPIKGVEMRLVGAERRYSHTRANGTTSSRVYKTLTLVDLSSRTEPRELSVGSHEYRTVFELPKQLPPTHSDAAGSIRYHLAVRVVIPWWPDRHEQYELAVAPAPWRASPAGGRVFATHPDGPTGGDIYIEATLDPNAVSVGGTLRGAVAVTSPKPVKDMKMFLVATNEARFQAPPAEVRRFEFTLQKPPSAGGQGSDFALALPADQSPSFDAGLMRLRWHLEARADIGWGRNATLSVPLVVAPLPATDAAAGASRHLPPVGRERRAKVWAHVASRHQLANDVDSETMTGSIGDVALRIALEQRGDGLFSVATLTWPDLEIGLTIREKRWADALSKSLAPIADEAFKSRFFVGGREAAQAAALLSNGALVRDLIAMPEAAIEDDGALLAAQGGGHRLDNLDAFVGSVRAIAAAAGEAMSRIPLPRAAQAAAPAWVAFAKRHQGRLVTGSLSLRGLSWEGFTLDVSTEWDDDRPSRTRVHHQLPSEIDLTSDTARRLLADAGKAHAITRGGQGELVWFRDGLVGDPAELAAGMNELAALAKRIAPADRRGPYR